ncbi:unnamed protein product [Rotaria socialis]|uniref:ABC transporter domain-containing protein n=1 Tax=Rotaria socialis TaxID=392032 RepID=A0A818PXE2_9BILA|nr:unnamed protein product [Rotaria socialis]
MSMVDTNCIRIDAPLKVTDNRLNCRANFYCLLFFFNTFSGEYETIEKYTHSFSNGRSSLSRRNFYGTPIVHVNHLVKKVDPDTIAVNDVTLDLCENQIISLLEPNGSGKTSIFNCLIGMHKQTSDQIIIENEDGISFDTQTNIVINKRNNCRTNDIKRELHRHVPKLSIETDISDGDVVFRTNQQRNDQFIQALHHLEVMQKRKSK